MKRFKGKLISVLLVVSLLLSIFTINASATSEEYNTVAHHHFDNLTNHIPKNVNESCSYVAASLLLSFYDSYWHDDIIAECYEYASVPTCTPNNSYPTGVAKLLTENSEWNAFEAKEKPYSEFIYSSNSNGKLIDQYFHLYLLSLGIEQGFYEDGANSESYGITLDEQAAILDFYFDLRFGPNDYVLPYGETNEDIPFNIHVLYEFSPNSSRDTVLQIIEEQVESGNPVLYSGARLATEDEEANADTSSLENDEKEAHAMIAYNVDEDGFIDLHTGYGTGSHSKYPGTDFNLDIGVLWIEINEETLPHSCSNNYRWAPTDSYVCSCEAYKNLHPEHIHEDSGDLLRRDATTHTYECIWGDEITEPHDLYYEKVSSGYHRLACDCGYKDEQLEMYHMLRKNVNYSICTDCAHIIYHNNGIIEVPGIESVEGEEELPL